MTFLGKLHVITDASAGSPGHLAVAAHALQGGADVIQFREKGALGLQQRVELGLELRRLTTAAGAQLIVNDSPQLAEACSADGVHLGRDDDSPAEARRRLGATAIIGGTANSVEEALQRAESGVDYLGVGPVFGTRSKANPAPPLGIDALRRIVRAVEQPVVAIGNIRFENLEQVLDAGVYGVAVLSAVSRAADPREATERLATKIDAHAGRSS